MEGDGIKGGILRSSSLEVHVVSHRDVPNIFGDLFFILLIDEDKSVMLGVTPIIEHPLSTRVISLVFFTTDRDVGRGRGRGCHTLEERRQLILHSDCVSQVRLDEVSECGDVCEVGDSVVFANGDGEG
jgi:hypothetical protein